MKLRRGLPTTDALLLAGKEVFSAAGYEQASMDDVARRAGTTKRTLYNHFQSKEALFRAVVENGAVHFLQWLPRPDPERPLADELERFLARFVELTTWTGAVGIQRVMIAEAARFPDLARLLHDEALGRAETVLAEHLRATTPARMGKAAAIEHARWLIGMASASKRDAVLLGRIEPLPDPPGPEIAAGVDRRAVRRAVCAFLDLRRALADST